MNFNFFIAMLISTLVASVFGAPAATNSVRDPQDAPLFPASAPSKPIAAGDPAPDDSTARGWPFVELFAGKDYTGDVFRLAFRDMLGKTCVNVERDIGSVKLWDMDTEYWCRIYAQLDCQWDTMLYADLPGATGYSRRDLKQAWDHKVGSMQCWPGEFEQLS